MGVCARMSMHQTIQNLAEILAFLEPSTAYGVIVLSGLIGSGIGLLAIAGGMTYLFMKTKC